jgi:hypothetical protein
MLSPDELAQVRRENERYLTDRLVHLRRTVATGDRGQQVETFATVATWACGMAYSPFKFRSREVLRGGDRASIPVSEILVRARLPQAAQGTIDSDDRVALVEKFGEPVDPPELFDVQGYEERTIYGLVLNLRMTGV